MPAPDDEFLEDIHAAVQEEEDELTEMGQAAQELKQMIKDEEQEEQLEKDILNKLQRASKGFKQVESEMKEVEQLWRKIQDGAGVRALNDNERQLLLEDSKDIHTKLSAILTLIEEAEEEFEQVKELQSEGSQLMNQVTQLEKKMEKEAKDIEQRWTEAENIEKAEININFPA